MIRSSILSVLTVLLAVSLSACAGNRSTAGDKPGCKDPKGGTIITVNEYCAVMNEDPVDPAVPYAEWKGQKVGFCCQGCLPKWAKMTDAEKDAAVSRAIAKGKVPKT